jgi:arylsulfatase A-like enzyme
LIDPEFLSHLPEGEQPLPAYLHRHGYQCWHVGKWHLGDYTQGYGPLDAGFQKNIGGHHYGSPPQGYFAPWGIASLQDPAPASDGREPAYLTGRLTHEALQLFEE